MTHVRSPRGAIEELDVPVDGAALKQVCKLADRLSAKISEAVGEFDAAELWDLDGATSMTAWLRHEANQSSRDASRHTKTGRRLRACPATRSAWTDGSISSGQVQAVVANVSDRHVGLWPDHEAAVVPTFEDLSTPDTAGAMVEWRRRADVELGDPDKPDEPRRSLHVSKTMDARRELSGHLDPEAGEVVTAAMRLASTADAEGESRTPAHKRADALVDVCRWFLDHQHGHHAGRHRPHVNVRIDLPELEGRGQARLLDGTVLDPTTTGRLLCDAGIHRYLTDGASTVLDYGTATRTISPALWNALMLRDGGCTWPGCDRSAEWCEAHHLTFWQHGGPTSLDNLAGFCSRHHHKAHQPGWHAKRLGDGTIEITTPDGRTLTRPPPRE